MGGGCMKPSLRGLVTGRRCEIAVGGGAGRWCVRVQGTEVVDLPTCVPYKTVVGGDAGVVWVKGTEGGGPRVCQHKAIGFRRGNAGGWCR